MSCILQIVFACVLPVASGCSQLQHSPLNLPSSPLTLIVGPVALDAAITKSTQIHTFNEPPGTEIESVTLATLLDEARTHAQRVLTDRLARQTEFVVVPFGDARRAQADIGPSTTAWTHEQLLWLARGSDADIVMDAHILDYGVVRWQYWVTGWLTHASVATTVVGLVSAWNPAAIGAYLAFDATTDLPLWYGGAQVFGWAFRPVRVQIDALQLNPCEGLVWSAQELVIKVPGEALADYSPEEQTRKEVQLEANLNKAFASLTQHAADTLTRQSCNERGQPQKVAGFSMWSWLDWLH